MNRDGRDDLGELNVLVDTLTTSGSEKLDGELLKKLKNICKSSDENVHHLYRLVMSQLEKQHAEIRLSSFQIINEIFTRSHAFRLLVTDNLQELFALTLGTSIDKALPEPSNTATMLKNQSFQAIEKWNEKFGPYYKKLGLGYKYLKNVKKIGFDGQQVNTVVERRRREVHSARQANQTEQKLTTVLTEMGEIVNEIKSITVEIGNCFNLVLPSLDNFEIYEHGFAGNDKIDDSNKPSTSQDYYEPSLEASDNSKDTSKQLRRSQCISVAVNKTIAITETQDNTDILNTLREQERQITKKYLPMVQKWLDILTKNAGHQENLVQAINLKNTLVDLQQKFKSLKIIPNINVGKSKSVATRADQEEESDEEESFVEVPEKDGLEHVAKADRYKYGLSPMSASESSDKELKGKESGQKSATLDTIFWHPNGESHEESTALADPCSRATAVAALAKKQLHKNGPQQFSKSTVENEQVIKPLLSAKNIECSDDGKGTKSELLKKAPVVPFGMDLYHWGSNEEEAPSVLNLKNLHCFWAHGDDNDDHCPDDMRESLKSRTIKFTGEFEEVKWACRAPLPSGKLCPRRDKYKCPFHGTIISRDEIGRPSSEASSDAGPSNETETSTQEMAEITLDIEKATGLNLTNKKQQKGKKRKHSGLTNLKKSDTSRSRLERKVFSKSSLERVADEMDRVRKSLIDEKFGNKWNYALSK